MGWQPIQLGRADETEVLVEALGGLHPIRGVEVDALPALRSSPIQAGTNRRRTDAASLERRQHGKHPDPAGKGIGPLGVRSGTWNIGDRAGQRAILLSDPDLDAGLDSARDVTQLIGVLLEVGDERPIHVDDQFANLRVFLGSDVANEQGVGMMRACGTPRPDDSRRGQER